MLVEMLSEETGPSEQIEPLFGSLSGSKLDQSGHFLAQFALVYFNCFEESLQVANGRASMRRCDIP